MGLVEGPADGIATVNIWQANIGKKIVNHVPMRDGEVVELGTFELDGVAFPAAEVRVEFLDPAADEEGGDAGGAMFPTGNRIDLLDVPGLGRIEATLINAGNPTIFVDAARLGLAGTELQGDVNGDKAMLQARRGRAGAGRRRPWASSPRRRRRRPGGRIRPSSPSWRSPRPTPHPTGKRVEAESIDLLARIFSMGVLHHAMTGTGAVAIAAAAAIPGTVGEPCRPCRRRRPRSLRAIRPGR